MIRNLIILTLSSLFLFGCGTTYVYKGGISTLDSSGKNREVQAYWTKTERPMWFDTASGSVRLLTECSANNVAFDETDEGIIFRRRPNDEGVERDIPLNGECGKIMNANKIEDLGEGVLSLEIHCKPVIDEFSQSTIIDYIQARREAYEFQIKREEDSGVPKRPACRE